MNQTEFIYFFIGVLSMFLGMLIYPHVSKVKMFISQYFTRKKHTPNVYCDDLQSQINDLQTQVDNLAEKLATRDRDRRSNLRRDVRDYLKELQNK